MVRALRVIAASEAAVVEMAFALWSEEFAVARAEFQAKEWCARVNEQRKEAALTRIFANIAGEQNVLVMKVLQLWAFCAEAALRSRATREQHMVLCVNMIAASEDALVSMAIAAWYQSLLLARAECQAVEARAQASRQREELRTRVLGNRAGEQGMLIAKVLQAWRNKVEAVRLESATRERYAACAFRASEAAILPRGFAAWTKALHEAKYEAKVVSTQRQVEEAHVRATVQIKKQHLACVLARIVGQRSVLNAKVFQKWRNEAESARHMKARQKQNMMR
eukprot:CAMPEP_0117618882 /NCGR_PEP_ID=MMETSP0784-20121206/86334_1 /TAXON_ID=39447 /ORGANISM="" /LENGTH=279 /DNA_ID=CAMNT_0005422763 /DNA_START=80 /DNA_END=915 /DNA_ORIENTATION=+